MSEADQLIARQHANPHAYLGAHPENGSVVVRTFRPAAVQGRGGGGRTGRTPRSSACTPAACSRASIKGAELPLAYQLEVDYGESGTITIDDPYRFLPTIGELDLHLLGEGRHEELWERLGAHVTEVDGVTGTAFAVWAPSRPRGLRGRRLQLLGRPHAPDAHARLVRHLGAVPARRRAGRALQVRDPRPGRRDPPEGRPDRVRDRGPAEDGLGGARPAARVGATRSGSSARGAERRARGPDVDLRGPPRLVAAEPARGQPLADLPRAGRRAVAPTRRTWASPTSSCCR